MVLNNFRIGSWCIWEKSKFIVCDNSGIYCSSYLDKKKKKKYKTLTTLKILNYVNKISDKKLESVDEIGVIHCLITFNTLRRDGVEIVPKSKEAA